MMRRAALAQVAWRSGALNVAARLLPPPLLVLAYHRVMPLPERENDYPFDLELVSATPEEFRWQVDHVVSQCNPVSMQQVVDWAEGVAELPERAVCITFDDGFDDNYHHAFPILRERGVPATVFASTDLIGTDTVFWYEQVAYAMMNGPVGQPLPESVEARCASGTLPGWRDDTPFGRRRLLATVLNALKDESTEYNRCYVAKLAATCPVDAGHAAQSHALTWAQVAEMAAGGIDFGSHGASHALLSRLPPAELEAELARSRDTLSKATGRDVASISYPVGSSRAFDDRVVDAVKAAGYRVGFSYISGVAGEGRDQRYALPRLHVERYTSRAAFAGMLALPQVLG